MPKIYIPNVVSKQEHYGPFGVGVPTQIVEKPGKVMWNFPNHLWHNWTYTYYNNYAFIPSIYNYYSYITHTELIDLAISKAKSNIIFVANEPETFDTTYGPKVYVELFNTLKEKFPNKKIVGPNCNWNSTGLAWLEKFVEYGGYPDQWGIHFYYDSPEVYSDYVNAFFNWIENKDMYFGVHVTETAGNKNIPLSGQKDIMEYIKSISHIFESIFWFSARYSEAWENTALTNDDNSLTELGEMWK